MAVSTAAFEYFGSMSPTAARVVADLDGEIGETESPLWFFRGCGGRKTIRDETFRDEHSAPFFFRTNSQIELIAAAEPPPPPPAPVAQLELDRELVLSHSRVVSELKNALKTDVPRRISHIPVEQETHNEAPEVAKNEAGFISKLLGNKRFKSGAAEERERLVSSERRHQIVASSDNCFKTDFDRNFVDGHGFEESKALLAGGSFQESSATSTDSDFLSCEEMPTVTASPSSSAFILPKTGYDFLDNW